MTQASADYVCKVTSYTLTVNMESTFDLIVDIFCVQADDDVRKNTATIWQASFTIAPSRSSAMRRGLNASIARVVSLCGICVHVCRVGRQSANGRASRYFDI